MSKRKVAASLRVGATAAVECASSRSNGYAAATLAPSKGRLMRCTVDGLTLNRSAMTRMPGRPGVARASRIRFSSAGAIGEADQDASPRSGPSQARRGRVPGSWRARTRQTRPSSGTWPCPRRRRGVDALLMQEQVDAQAMQLGEETAVVLAAASQWRATPESANASSSGTPAPALPLILVPGLLPRKGYGYIGGQWGTLKHQKS